VLHIGTLALAGISHLSFSLNIGTTGSRVPQKSLIWIHAISKPDAAWAGLQGSAQTRRRVGPGNFTPSRSQIPDAMLSHHPARAVPERPAPFVQV